MVKQGGAWVRPGVQHGCDLSDLLLSTARLPGSNPGYQGLSVPHVRCGWYLCLYRALTHGKGVRQDAGYSTNVHCPSCHLVF